MGLDGQPMELGGQPMGVGGQLSGILSPWAPTFYNVPSNALTERIHSFLSAVGFLMRARSFVQIL